MEVEVRESKRLEPLTYMVTLVLTLVAALFKPSVDVVVLSFLLMPLIIVLHELLHIVAVRLVSGGGRFRWSWRRLAPYVEFDRLTPRGYLVAALAPQVITVVLLSAGLILYSKLLVILAFMNLVGSLFDIVSGVYYGIAHSSALAIEPLYDERGEVCGSVVFYPERVIVYS